MTSQPADIRSFTAVHIKFLGEVRDSFVYKVVTEMLVTQYVCVCVRARVVQKSGPT